jgi:cyclopropane fatty-acyl-phospholipid synthase-like methyltransferase
MTTRESLNQFLDNFQKDSEYIYVSPHREGYWSNLSKQQNDALMSILGTRSTRECIAATQPFLSDVIFSEKRAAGLELLQLTGTETAVDLGCMWGAITIPLAKQVARVIGVDQTIESLRFSEARAKEENLENISFVCGNLRELALPRDAFDIAVVNGVLEWIPELEPVVVDDYWYKAKARSGAGNPGEMQMTFLKNVHSGLRASGRIMLAIENRYDYKMFCGIRDPHTGTLFTTIVSRWCANLISIALRKREYRPWIYSFKELEAMLKDAGFKSVELHACWPDYRFPEHINIYGEKSSSFTPMSARKNGKIGFKKLVANRLEWLLFKVFNLQFFAPSIIAIATK